MSFFFHVVLGVHIAAGILALLVFWLPLVTKKGGKLHRRVGWVYVGAAATVAVSGMLTCAHLVLDGGPGRARAGMFLAYVGLLAGASAQLGVRALRRKKAPAARSAIDLMPPALLIGCGLALALLGVAHGKVLYVLFSLLGIAQGVTHLRYWLTPPAHDRAWFLAHMTAMGTSCITTVTAFVVVNAQRFGMHTFDLPIWLTPIVLGVVGLSLWRRSYAKRFASS